jgi:hypothetical protein
MSSRAFVFCKPILPIFYKETSAPIRHKKQRLVVSSRAFVFCKPILPIFYKETNAPIRHKKQRIVMSLRALFVSMSLWRTKKVALSRLGKKGYENVDNKKKNNKSHYCGI